MKQEKCSKCDHEWIPRVLNPTECPNCKRRDWRSIKERKENKGDAF